MSSDSHGHCDRIQRTPTTDVITGNTAVRPTQRNVGGAHSQRVLWGLRCGDVILLISLLFFTGCPTAIPSPGTNVEDGNRDPMLTGSVVGAAGEPNGSFASPITALFDAAGTARLQGTVSVPGDLDVFLLGALSGGDEIVVDASTPGSVLDATVALFDDQQRLIYTNDDRGTPATSDGLDPFFTFTLRHDSDAYYLVISNSPFAGTGQFTGTYQVDVNVTPGGSVPAPVGQILFLEFRGASLTTSPLGPITLAPFDAAAIHPVYDGQTEVLKELIRASVQQNYERFDVTVLTSDDPPPNDGVEFTTIYVGGFSGTLFGIADDVDLYNADFCDDAIIFAESFAPNIFSQTPTVEELAIAIGNIASHESGHLLGLNHVSDDLAIMDDQSAADAFLEDQEFMRAPLSSDILNLGFQDSALLLTEIVGPKAAP